MSKIHGRIRVQQSLLPGLQDAGQEPLGPDEGEGVDVNESS